MRGQPVQVGKRDLVIFPAGMSCTWQIRSDIRKHLQANRT
nr:cupin domain-containing protein [Chroococcidiopsis sp. CCMEE 29]